MSHHGGKKKNPSLSTKKAFKKEIQILQIQKKNIWASIILMREQSPPGEKGDTLQTNKETPSS